MLELLLVEWGKAPEELDGWTDEKLKVMLDAMKSRHKRKLDAQREAQENSGAGGGGSRRVTKVPASVLMSRAGMGYRDERQKR